MCVNAHRVDPARADLRHPHRREPELVHRPLIFIYFLPAAFDTCAARRRLHHGRHPVPSSSCRSRCTSSATRGSPGATASRSRDRPVVLRRLAKLNRDTESPGEEFRVARPDPRSRCSWSLACAGGLMVGGSADFGDALVLRDTRGRARRAGLARAGQRRAFVFNLIPAFPLDGGRIAARRVEATGDRNRGTRFSARLGQPSPTCSSPWALSCSSAARGSAGSGGCSWAGSWPPRPARWSRPRSRSAWTASRSPTSWTPRPFGCPATRPCWRLRTSSSCATAGTGSPSPTRPGSLSRPAAPGTASTAPSRTGRPALVVADVVDADGDEAFRVHDDTPIEQLMGSEGLRSLGALMVIDRDDRLRGVVTLEQVRRALAAAAPGQVA